MIKLHNGNVVQLEYFYPKGKTGSRTQVKVVVYEDENKSKILSSHEATVRRHGQDPPNTVAARNWGLIKVLKEMNLTTNLKKEIWYRAPIRPYPGLGKVTFDG